MLRNKLIMVASVCQGGLKMLDDQQKKAKKQPVKIIIEGMESVRKKVQSCGTCGRVYLPSSWAGKTVAVIRLSQNPEQYSRADQKSR